MAAEKNDKVPNDREMELYGLDIFYLEKKESVQAFLSRLPKTIVIKEEIDTKKDNLPKYSKYTKSCSWIIETSLGNATSTNIFNHWVTNRPSREDMSWLHIMPQRRRSFQAQKTITVEGNVRVIGGSMISPVEFVRHLEEVAVAEFHQDSSVLVLTVFGIAIEIKLSHDFLHQHIIMELQDNETLFCFNVKFSPKLFIDPYTRKQRIPCRGTRYPTFGLLTSFCIHFKNESPIASRLLWYLRFVDFTIVHAHLNISDQLQEMVLEINNFDIAYTWRSLCSQGYKVNDQLSTRVLDEIIKENCRYSDVFTTMAESVAGKPFFHFKEEMQDAIKLTESGEFNNKVPQNYIMVRRAVLTPSRLIFLSKEPVYFNRILRQYNVDYFIRIVYRDEDFDKVCGLKSSGPHLMLEDMKQHFVSGFTIHGRHYDFLGCSNSQLREHSFWFFSSYDGISADFIRQTSGDLSKERCVASYVSRFGLCFSSSWNTLTIEEHQEVRIEKDVTRNGYCFTDGIGKISKRLAAKVAKSMDLNIVPSAFQIRYGGCKGVIAIDPSLGENREILVIRESMKKFESNSRSVEVLQYSRPVQLHLNRQVITLLSGLKIRNDFFQELQEKMLFELSDMLLDNDVALVNLRELSIGIDFENLHQKRINFVCEPFFRSLLTCIFHRKLKDLKTRTRIQIPLHKGRYMMGTSDETKSLAYGQVFIQYSLEPHHNMKKVKTVLGKVVVTKNPCFHPGDLRILEAVDIPGLRHMVDCIVFPQCGSRPHPNEMSGSDLDGDEYFVCWDERLHSIENQNPMDFPKAKKKRLESDITVPDIVEFIANYIQNDNLGIIANSHLALADYEPDGIFSSSCIKLAKMHSDAVDFPKTGNAPSLQNFKSPEKYPDFMMKRDKLQYTSSKIIGKLYRQCRFLLPKAQLQAFINDFGECDIPFLPLSQRDIENAILQRNVYNESILQIMNAYGIENEAEACTGLVESAKSKRGCLKDETYNVEKAIRSQISVLFERTRKEFFKEFCVGKNLSVLESILISRKALAWYTVTYEDRFRTPKQLLSFPWVVANVICQMKLTLLQTNAFDKIEQSIQTKIKSSESDQKRTVRTLKKLRRVIQTNIPKTKKYTYLFEHEVVSTNCCNEILGVEREDLKIFIRYMERHQDNSFGFEHDLIKKGVLCVPIKITLNEKVFLSLVTDESIKQLCGTLNDFLRKSHELNYVAQTLFENLRETADDRRPIDIIGWIFTLMLLEESAKQHLDLNRLSLGVFSKLLLCCLRNARGFVENCARSLCLPKPLKQWLVRNKKNIVHVCLQKYVEIAESLNVVSLSHAQGFEHETSESFLLPTESWSTIKYASIYARFKMMQISGADVYFHNVSFGKQEGLQMEAVGTVSQLSRLGKIVYDLSEKSKSLQSARNGRLSIHGTFSILFEGASESLDILNLEIYQGLCQGKHSHVAKYIPQLMDPNCNGSYGRDAFHDMFMSQWRIVQSEYDSIFHGDLCIVLALGYFYIMDIKCPTLSISDLNQYLSSYQERLENQRSRIKVPYSFSFLPINSNLENIKEILSEHFLEIETEKRVKVRFGKLGMCDLDENQSFLQWNAPEIKWFIGQIICKCKKRFRNRTSVRCKMQSYRNLNQKALQSMEEYEHLVDHISNGSLCEKNGNVYIIKNNNVKYIREKEITVYSNINLNSKNETWRSIRVEMSQIREYEVDFFGSQCAKCISERTELAIIPPTPDTKSTDAEIRNYVDSLWDIALYFGNVIDS